MKTASIFVAAFLFSALAYGQSATGIHKEEAIRMAAHEAEIFNPPMNSDLEKNAQAVYMPNENSWIVDFSDESSSAMSDSDYMLRVEASSGRSPELLQGSQKQRYRSYFTNPLSP